ncbi:MAG: hypothetical protein ACLSC9_12900 [Barnesiella sp.]
MVPETAVCLKGVGAVRPLIHPAFRLFAGREDKVYSSGGMDNSMVVVVLGVSVVWV